MDATRLHSVFLMSYYTKTVPSAPSVDQTGVLHCGGANNKDMEVLGWVLSLNVRRGGNIPSFLSLSSNVGPRFRVISETLWAIAHSSLPQAYCGCHHDLHLMFYQLEYGGSDKLIEASGSTSHKRRK